MTCMCMLCMFTYVMRNMLTCRKRLKSFVVALFSLFFVLGTKSKGELQYLELKRIAGLLSSTNAHLTFFLLAACQF